jgi:hypothetical protein
MTSRIGRSGYFDCATAGRSAVGSAARLHASRSRRRIGGFPFSLALDSTALLPRVRNDDNAVN